MLLVPTVLLQNYLAVNMTSIERLRLNFMKLISVNTVLVAGIIGYRQIKNEKNQNSIKRAKCVFCISTGLLYSPYLFCNESIQFI